MEDLKRFLESCVEMSKGEAKDEWQKILTQLSELQQENVRLTGEKDWLTDELEQERNLNKGIKEGKDNWISVEGVKKFSIVEVCTSPRSEPSLATVLELTEVDGDKAALVQHHFNSCLPDTIALEYLKPITPPGE